MNKGNTPGYEFATTVDVRDLDKLTHKEIFEKAKANRMKLDACPRHYFGELGEVKFGMKLTCQRCGGEMSAIQANDYCRGYEAAGGNPDEIITDFRGDDTSPVTCPVCNGVCGVDVSASLEREGELIDLGPDWHDCDFCDATGKVERAKALQYIDGEVAEQPPIYVVEYLTIEEASPKLVRKPLSDWPEWAESLKPFKE